MVTRPLVVYAQHVFAFNRSGIVGIIQKCWTHSEHLDVCVCVCTYVVCIWMHACECEFTRVTIKTHNNTLKNVSSIVKSLGRNPWWQKIKTSLGPPLLGGRGCAIYVVAGGPKAASTPSYQYSARVIIKEPGTTASSLGRLRLARKVFSCEALSEMGARLLNALTILLPTLVISGGGGAPGPRGESDARPPNSPVTVGVNPSVLMRSITLVLLLGASEPESCKETQQKSADIE